MLFHHHLFGVLVLVALMGCAPPVKVAVEERQVLTVRQEVEALGGQLIRNVQPGDTLHGISFALGLNVNKLAAWNEIDDTSKLRVGQRIRLTEPIGFKSRTVSAASPSRPKSTSQSSSAPKSAPVAAIPRATSRPDKPRSSSAPSVQAKLSMASSADAWFWPTKGTVVGRFTAGKGHQGIDIRAPKGQAVTAARSGEIVYVGNSLKGYGNLIIVKHDEEYLSAYAHNQDIYVREGQTVRPQQKIATIGTNNKRVAALHFQIRQEGKPVDPLKFLPSS